MPVSELLKAPFEPCNYYHIVFKSIDGLLLFQEETDYYIFLKRLKEFTGFLFDTWAYCQLQNHVHLIVKARPAGLIFDDVNNMAAEKQTVSMKKFLNEPTELIFIDEMFERQVNSFMVSFANFSKNKYKRQGGLFQKPFKRILISNDSWLQQAIIYVHANPLKHKISKNYESYRHSSYAEIVSAKTVNCDVKSVLLFFGGLNKSIHFHEKQIAYFYQNDYPSFLLE